MNDLNRLGIRIVIIVFTTVLLVAAIAYGIQWFLNRSDTESATESEQVAQARADSDNDGLPDLFENIYHTDPEVIDTDNDGLSDYEELGVGRDPAIPGPNDVSKPPTGENIIEPNTFTGKYLATLPTDAAREEVLSQDRLEAFVELNRGQLLPTLPPESVKTTPATGKDAITAYLDAISSTQNEQIISVSNDDIEAALAAQLQLNKDLMDQVIAKLAANITALQTVPAPTEVVTLHTKLLQASEALHTNVQSLRTIDADFVGGLIASKNIDELGAVFQDIGQQIIALETKYEIK